MSVIYINLINCAKIEPLLILTVWAEKYVFRLVCLTLFGLASETSSFAALLNIL